MNPDNSLTVSVVIPAFNAASFIQDTLSSIHAQTYSSYEVVVVDDGSSDDTQQVVEGYFQRSGMHGRCIRQDNKGIAAARNAGMRAATGAFIALLDHDDLWYSDKLAVAIREFELHPDADLICHNENIVKDGRRLRVTRRGPAVRRMYERLLFSGNELSPSATVFKREKALAIGGFREIAAFDTVEDYDFWLRMSQVARFHFIGQALGEYRVVDRAASRRVEYHHANMEHMLRHHFCAYFGECPGVINRLRIRRRLSLVYRSAGTQLMAYGEAPQKQRDYMFRMLREFPLEPKNIVRALLWAVQSARRHKAQPETS